MRWKVSEFKHGAETTKHWRRDGVQIDSSIFSDNYCRYHVSVTVRFEGSDEIVWSMQDHHQTRKSDAVWKRGDMVADAKAWLEKSQ